MKLKHFVRVVGATAVAIGAAGGLATADGGDRGGGRTVRVEFTPTDFDVQNEALVCNPTDPADPPPPCAQVFTVTATQTGDLAGSTVQASTLATNGADPTLLPQNVTGTFAGSVKRCGNGVFLYSGRGNLDLISGLSTMTYTIVEGSGTGDLAGITGQLRQSGPSGAEVPITGTVRCRPPR